jgi:ABC-2 type transport system ATP-binding protein
MIEVTNIKKNFRDIKALDDITFTINPGEIVGLLGPNGSGKTTLLRIMTSYMEQDSGTVTVNGYDTLTRSLDIRRSIGYLPENNILYPQMRVIDFLRFVGRSRGLSGEYLINRLNWCIESLELEDALRKKNIECSKGFRQRISLASALIHDPGIILLDEPTSGLDPIQIVAFREFIKSLSENRIILLSSHVLQEISATATRIIIIHKGKIIDDILKGGILPEGEDRSTEKLEDFFLKSVNFFKNGQSDTDIVDQPEDTENTNTENTEPDTGEQ